MVVEIVVGVAVVVVLLYVVVTFNALIRRRARCDASYGQIEVQLTKRHDLVPNLVETVKGYAGHERETFAAVTAARAAAVQGGSPATQAAAEDGLTKALRSVFAVAEAYPDLKASSNFLDLQQQLSSVESGIAYARQYFNDAVQSYETARTSFPTLLVAAPLGFRPREYFRAVPGQEAPVSVDF
jgi:LemA protein